MTAFEWIAVALVVVTGGWMLFDGIHSLVTGHFVVPRTGEYAGRLGPWARLFRALRVDPLSRAVRVGFVVYGTLYLLAGALYVADMPLSAAILILFAALGLWYLPFGTVFNAIVILIVLVSS